MTGESKDRIQGVYIPIGSVLTTIVALFTFWISFSGMLDARFGDIQKEVRIIRETIVHHHGPIPN